MSKNKDYAEEYTEYAMEQMRRYGIPASVTLAQGIIESSNGQSQLARNENNHFGIKATQAWIAGGGKYGLYTDDKLNEKFCSYGSVGKSYEHHSQFLSTAAVQIHVTGYNSHIPVSVMLSGCIFMNLHRHKTHLIIR